MIERPRVYMCVKIVDDAVKFCLFMTCMYGKKYVRVFLGYVIEMCCEGVFTDP